MGKVSISLVREAKANVEHNVSTTTRARMLRLYVSMGIWHIDAFVEAFETHAR